MPIHRYRSVSEMPAHTPTAPGEVEARIRAVWARAALLCPPRLARGVQRFRSIAEANAQREAERTARMRQTVQRSP